MRQIRKDERGSSLVMTIIAMTFISLLAVAVISMTITNIRLKQAQKSSQTNFYDADSIVDAIRAGVENLSDGSAREAYETVYAAYGAVRSGASSEALTDKYAKKYMDAMIVALSDGGCNLSTPSSNLYYKDEVIRGFLTEAQAKYSSGVFVDGYKSHVSGQGTLEYNSEDKSLLIKDLEVVKTEGDYQTTITTDIRVNLPEMRTGTNSEYLKYALIADNKVKIEGKTATINGDIYSGTVRRDTDADAPQAGFLIDSGAKLTVNARNVISRGDILVRGASEMSIDGLSGMTAKVWVENIQTKASTGGATGNKLTITGDMRVSDDLEMWGDTDTVTLSGRYYGYNYNKDYSSSEYNKVSNNANFSSSMIINGKKSTLNLEGLYNLTLAGKTFISKKGNEGESFAGAGAGYAGSNDIRTGESLAIKSSQLAYYVPKDFWKLVGPTGTTFSQAVVFSPIEGSGEQYEFDVDGFNNYINIPNFNVMDYVDSYQPLSYYYRHDTNVKDEDLIYFYLNISEDKLKEFYSLYASASPEYDTLKDVNAKYLSTNGIMLNNKSGNERCVFYISGNVLSGSPSGGEQITLSQDDPKVSDSILIDFAQEFSKEYMSLQMSLTSDYEVASKSLQFRLFDNDTDKYTKKGTTTATSDKTNLFAVLIDEDAFTDYENKSSADPNLPADSIIVFKTGDYEWNGSESGGIIVATGNVKLQKNFKGLVFAGGDIIFDGATQVDADSERLEKIFDVDEKVSDMFSKYFRRAITSSISKKDADDTDEGICYENWKKN